VIGVLKYIEIFEYSLELQREVIVAVPIDTTACQY